MKQILMCALACNMSSLIRKTSVAAALALGIATSAQQGFADTKEQISGSDTLAGVMTDAIIAAGMNNSLGYVGGGSGVGEKALANAEIGLTAMSREFNPELAGKLAISGVQVVPYVLALDGISVFVQKSSPLGQVDLVNLGKIFTCEFKTWDQIPNSGKSGAINAFRRNDQSGTTDTFKHLVGIKKFGDCVVVLNETQEIADKTSKDPNAIGYAGMSGKVDGNRALAISKLPGTTGIHPTTLTIRNGTYPLARRLFVYHVEGSRKINPIEQKFLTQLTDRSFMDPIVQDHDFITID